MLGGICSCYKLGVPTHQTAARSLAEAMQAGRELLFCCAALLQLLHCASERSTSQFVPAALCPSSDLLGQSAKSRVLCATACSLRLRCDMFHFRRETGICYLGNSSCAGLTLWTEGPCISHRTVRQSPEPIADRLSLKLLYRFATHGLENAADPLNHRLWGGTVPIDAEGAHFTTTLSSYLMAETPCFEKVVNRGNKFSFFVRAKHPLNIDGTYVSFRQCSGVNVAHDFYTYNGNTWHQVFWPSNGKTYLSKSGSVFTKSSKVALVSAGVSYDTDHDVSFFFNGSMHPATLDSTESASGLSSANFQCLQLGGFPGDAQYSVQGSISCFGLSTRLLTLAEFVQLDDWCRQG